MTIAAGAQLDPFLTRDGVVKILDFGVAKLTRSEGALRSSDETGSAAPTTASGTILGTAA